MNNGISNGQAAWEYQGRITSCNGVFLEFGIKNRSLKAKVNIVPASPYLLVEKENYSTVKNSEGIDVVEWAKPIETKRAGKIFLPQLSGIYAASIFGCELVDMKQECKFCAAPGYSGPKYSIENFIKEFEELSKGQPIKEVTLNAGSVVSLPLRGYEILAPYVNALAERGVKSLNLEVMPPQDLKDAEGMLGSMKDGGVTSVQFNIEIWNDKKRRKVMPFKGLIPKESYLESIAAGYKFLGAGKTSSVLLAGLNTIEELENGSKSIIEAGGVPSVEIFRPIKGTLMQNFKPNIDYAGVTKLNKKIQEELEKRYGTDIYGTLEGCLKCGGCNEIMKIV